MGNIKKLKRVFSLIQHLEIEIRDIDYSFCLKPSFMAMYWQCKIFYCANQYTLKFTNSIKISNKGDRPLTSKCIFDYFKINFLLVLDVLDLVWRNGLSVNSRRVEYS